MKKGFIGSLFDFSFSSFITVDIVRVLYILALIGSVLMFLAMLGGGAFALIGGKVGAGLFQIILAPVFLVVYVLLSRVWMEVLVVVFRIAENTGRIADASAGAAPRAMSR